MPGSHGSCPPCIGLRSITINISWPLHNSRSLRNALAALTVQGYFSSPLLSITDKEMRRLLSEIPTRSGHIETLRSPKCEAPSSADTQVDQKYTTFFFLCKTNLTSTHRRVLRPRSAHGLDAGVTVTPELAFQGERGFRRLLVISVCLYVKEKIEFVKWREMMMH